MFGTDPLRAHLGRQVVAHLADADLSGRLEQVTRSHAVLVDAVMLVPDRGETRKVQLDGEQHVPRSIWIQVAG